MSRVAKNPIPLLSGVEFKIDGNVVTIKGPLGSLTQIVTPGVGVNNTEGFIHISANDESRESTQ
jgi:large subunit ribosomal protein L6